MTRSIARKMPAMEQIAIAPLLVAAATNAITNEAAAQSAGAKPDGELRWALYVTLAPSWFDPGEITGGFLTPFWILYAMHDALVKPMPGNLMTPSLAESWTVSQDQRVYDFKLREGLKFHNGDPFTADDVKFSWDRSKVGKVYEFIWVSGIGPRVAEPGLMLIDPYPWAAPLEDVRLAGK